MICVKEIFSISKWSTFFTWFTCQSNFKTKYFLFCYGRLRNEIWDKFCIIIFLISKVDLTPDLVITFPFNFMNDQETQCLNNLLEQIRNKWCLSNFVMAIIRLHLSRQTSSLRNKLCNLSHYVKQLYFISFI